MANATHTPGPWSNIGRIDAADSRLLVVANDASVALVACADPDEEAANANLIAAAPDLLDVLREVRDFWAGGDAPEALETAIHAAIAKAEGRAA